MPAKQITSEPVNKRDSSHRVVNSLLAPYKIVWGALTVALVVPLISLWFVWHIVDAAKADFRVIAIDSADNFIIGPLKDVDQSPLFERAARLVVMGALSRSPTGFDNPDLIESLFYKQSLQNIRLDLDRQLPNLKAQNLHQKVEISRYQALPSVGTGAARKVRVFGQLIRAGNVSGYSATQNDQFRMILVLVPNPRLGERGEYPYVVNDYKLFVGQDAANYE